MHIIMISKQALDIISCWDVEYGLLGNKKTITYICNCNTGQWEAMLSQESESVTTQLFTFTITSVKLYYGMID